MLVSLGTAVLVLARSGVGMPLDGISRVIQHCVGQANHGMQLKPRSEV